MGAIATSKSGATGQRAKEFERIDAWRKTSGRRSVERIVAKGEAGSETKGALPQTPREAQPPAADKDAADKDQHAPTDLANDAVYDCTGLAFSGGGIRSAAVCLGVAQALDVHDAMPFIDYLSTVSGGGYVGVALAASMSVGGKFPYAASNDEPAAAAIVSGGAASTAGASTATDLQDSLAVQHIRDTSNYLVPHGFRDVLRSIGVMLRGLTVNVSVVVGPILLIAALAVLLHPNEDSLQSTDAVGFKAGELIASHFAVALGLAGLVALLLVYWGILRSIDERRGRAGSEFSGRWPDVIGWLIASVAIAAFVEAQPYVILWAIAAPKSGAAGTAGSALSMLQTVATWLAPAAGLLASIFSGFLSQVLKMNASDATTGGFVRRTASWIALGVAALVGPLTLWLAWLYLVVWGVAVGSGDSAATPWAAFAAPIPWAPTSPFVAYVVAGLLLTLLSWLMEPNANSLHRLYRDRLSDTFLVRVRPKQVDVEHEPGAVETERLNQLKLSALTKGNAPYLIVNTSLNIQGSRYVNRRGRNADFFSFTPDFVGSHATGIAPTNVVEHSCPTLDLGTIMAVSGAAASSNMGRYSIRALAPTLTLLNIRLGYWMKNPRYMDQAVWQGTQEPTGKRPTLRSRLPANLYLLTEMFSLLDESSELIYLTDGGHIENLGLYELLKRRCRFIVVIDAEADPSYGFQAFATLQRYARIDLGVRIEGLPWQQIRAQARSCDRRVSESAKDGSPLDAMSGCHAALGRIVYPNAPHGALLYLKASMTGDENDLVLAYKRANPRFPHETTGDQFFGEEQFEAYRALGFHMMDRILTGEDRVPGLVESEPDGAPLPGETADDAGDKRLRRLRELFGHTLPAATSSPTPGAAGAARWP